MKTYRYCVWVSISCLFCGSWITGTGHKNKNEHDCNFCSWSNCYLSLLCEKEWLDSQCTQQIRFGLNLLEVWLKLCSMGTLENLQLLHKNKEIWHNFSSDEDTASCFTDQLWAHWTKTCDLTLTRMLDVCMTACACNKAKKRKKTCPGHSLTSPWWPQKCTPSHQEINCSTIQIPVVLLCFGSQLLLGVNQVYITLCVRKQKQKAGFVDKSKKNTAES